MSACVCFVCVCVFEPTQPLQREFNYDMDSRIKKKKEKKNRPEFGQQWHISVCLASAKVVKRS